MPATFTHVCRFACIFVQVDESVFVVQLLFRVLLKRFLQRYSQQRSLLGDIAAHQLFLELFAHLRQFLHLTLTRQW